MNRIVRFSRTATLAILSAIVIPAASCTMKNQEAPPLTGPSEFGTSITVTVSPDVLALDGASQSLVTITVRDPNGKPVRNLSLRAEISMGGVRADFGSLSARNVVTGADGRATLVYTAPGAPNGASEDPNTLVDILVTPIGTDYNNQSSRLASIRLVAPGIVVPAAGLQPYFVSSTSSPTDHQDVFFDACNDPERPPCAPSNNPIATYSWNFGDGETATGRSATHSFDAPGTFVVTLTVTDAIGRTASTSQAIDVAGGTAPSASFTTSPEDPRAGEAVNFNAATSRPEPGRTIRSYRWDFGDGSQRTTSSAVTSHTYASPGTFSVTLVVTDDAGRQAVATGSVTIGTDAPTADFTYSPTGPAAGAPVNFNGNSSSAVAGRTIVSWSWDFPGGTPAASSSATPTTQFAFPGTYNVTLTVTDSTGKTGRVTKTVAVQ